MPLSQEHRAFQERLRKVMQEKIAPGVEEIDRTNRFPWEWIDILRREGFIGMMVPREYGGQSADFTMAAILAEESARVSGGLGMVLCTNNFSPLLYIDYGTPEQKEKYLRRLAGGALANMVAVSEPSAGTDVAAILTTAEKQDGYWVLNGDKFYIEPGEVADIIHVFAKTSPEKGSRGVSGFIVEKETPGFTVGKIADPLGLRGAGLAEIYLRDARVPADNLLGPEGGGIQVVRRGLDAAAAGAGLPLGMAQGALDISLDYARTRTAFGKPISAHQAVQFMLVDMAMEVEASRSYIYKCCALADQRERDVKLYQMSSAFANRVALDVTEKAVEIFSGRAVLEWTHPACRFWRDARANIGAGGTQNLKRLLVGKILFSERFPARGQGG
ncbi:MAG: acyl-CoA dehydrogenase family protein [Dehalococcoidia bacterium]